MRGTTTPNEFSDRLSSSTGQDSGLHVDKEGSEGEEKVLNEGNARIDQVTRSNKAEDFATGGQMPVSSDTLLGTKILFDNDNGEGDRFYILRKETIYRFLCKNKKGSFGVRV